MRTGFRHTFHAGSALLGKRFADHERGSAHARRQSAEPVFRYVHALSDCQTVAACSELVAAHQAIGSSADMKKAAVLHELRRAGLPQGTRVGLPSLARPSGFGADGIPGSARRLLVGYADLCMDD